MVAVRCGRRPQADPGMMLRVFHDADEVQPHMGDCRGAVRRVLCATSTNGYDASYAAISGNNGGQGAIGNCASAACRSAKRGTPASRLMARGVYRKRRHWRSRYHCASSPTWDYRILHHGRNSIHRTAGYVTRTSGGVGGRGREAFSYPG